MSADAWFTGTDAHPVCQDYALATIGADGMGRAVVCDGCSGAQMSDWGARLLAWEAIRNPYRPDCSVQHLRQWLRDRAYAVKYKASMWLDLPCESQSATLLFLQEEPVGVTAIVAGDGYLLARTRNGEVEIHCFTAQCEAPFYPRYLTDPELLCQYVENYGHWEHQCRGMVDIAVAKGVYKVNELGDVDGPYPQKLVFDRERYDVVLAASDGLARFSRLRQWYSGRVGVSDTEVVDRIMQFKSLAGLFVQRRMRAEMCAMVDAGWRFSDDVAVAGITMEA